MSEVCSCLCCVVQQTDKSGHALNTLVWGLLTLAPIILQGGGGGGGGGSVESTCLPSLPPNRGTHSIEEGEFLHDCEDYYSDLG